MLSPPNSRHLSDIVKRAIFNKELAESLTFHLENASKEAINKMVEHLISSLSFQEDLVKATASKTDRLVTLQVLYELCQLNSPSILDILLIPVPILIWIYLTSEGENEQAELETTILQIFKAIQEFPTVSKDSTKIPLLYLPNIYSQGIYPVQKSNYFMVYDEEIITYNAQGIPNDNINDRNLGLILHVFIKEIGDRISLYAPIVQLCTTYLMFKILGTSIRNVQEPTIHCDNELHSSIIKEFAIRNVNNKRFRLHANLLLEMISLVVYLKHREDENISSLASKCFSLIHRRAKLDLIPEVMTAVESYIAKEL
ncbi:hypothetical protein ROZALSC1DRAFT_29128 [Rozella allomycis CSF55]|uniref:Uncharacterized protein n=1 Tax=Rozella allomycis (strain CSF55) TaxID=988480 RepID=A0A075AU78_ROZAC|nr:hypothetical protein O9G_000476 [Rozella allomycis CSF55]RKP19253.1 hypothetical protein ROZALSC1DRAFT_29128 [Rozella allomycis CSF55]|eukprot:EPZ33700.1 hypothetical protein O9G_000476 [Rozella allomycis CSF55]